MNIGKSIKVGMAVKGLTRVQLSRKIEVSPEYLTNMSRKETGSSKMITKLSKALDMKESEFIALGE